MYCRYCPRCNEKLNYTSKYSYLRADKKNSVCSSCIQKSRKNGKEVECSTCNKFFYKQPNQIKNRNYCSRSCADTGHSIFLLKTEYKEVECPYCKVKFQQHWKGPKKYCSNKCSSRANLKTINSTEPKKSGTQPELMFKEILEENSILFNYQKSVSWKHGWKKWYDFYLPEFNLLVEIDGTYWHGKEVETKELNKQQWKTRLNDKFKNILAKSRGYKLLRIWSDEINNLNLKEILKCYE